MDTDSAHPDVSPSLCLRSNRLVRFCAELRSSVSRLLSRRHPLTCPLSKERGYHIVIGIAISLVGLIITVTCHTSQVQYAGLCILLFGSYIAAPLTIAWLSGNTPEPGKRSLILGVNGFGNLAGIIGSQVYKKRYAPRYLLPFYVTLSFVAAALVGYIAYRFTLKAVNKRRQAILADMSVEEVHEERADGTRYADRKWTFRYGL
jgi:MFS family permease